MITNEITVEQRMEMAIAKAKEARKVAKDEAKLALIDNEDYIGYLASIEDEQEIITKLQGVMDTANKMKAIVTADQTKYGVHCYPVAEYIFGPVMARVMGLINASSSMFTDERQAEFQALTGVKFLALTKARDSIGSPAYFSKGVFADSIGGNIKNRESAILAVLQGLDLDTSYASQFDISKLLKWFDASENKARKQKSEYSKNELVDSTSDFLLED